MDHFGFVKAVDSFGESVILAVANATDRRFDSGFRQSFGIFDREILAAVLAKAGIRVMNETTFVHRPSVVNSLFQGIPAQSRHEPFC